MGLWVDMTRLLHHPRSRTHAASSTLNHGFFPNLQILRHAIVSCFILVMYVCCFILFSHLRHGIVSYFILDVCLAQYVCCFIFFVPFAVSLECCNSCDGILLSIVISNAGTDFNSNLLIQCLEFVFSNLFKISDMMVFVCWRLGMTTVLNLQFSYIVMHNFFLKLLT